MSILTFKEFIAEEEYKGSHEAPDKDGGCPMHDLTQNGIYPNDVYGHRGFDYSNTGRKDDYEAHYNVTKRQGKPWSRVAIYRAVPKDRKIKDINAGDWVTHNRKYALEHGRSNIGVGKYKVLKKTAYAHELFTDGNSIHEWGYHPTEMTPEKVKERENDPHVKAAKAKWNSPEAIAKRQELTKRIADIHARFARIDSMLKKNVSENQ